MITLRTFNLPDPLSKLLTLLGFDLTYIEVSKPFSIRKNRRDPMNIFKTTAYRRQSKKRKRLTRFLTDHRRRCSERSANGAPGLSPPPTDFSSSYNCYYSLIQ
jgi:hypothetical protein